jgi:TetR/AcrR family transcriptional regulator, regulator of autoinduction and epiphytic fitness
VTSRPTPRGAVDPRVTLSRQLILKAALEELGGVGYGAFGVESVAARSGVAKSTIYRHWPTKLALIADAFRTFHEQDGPDLEDASARERLVRIVRHVAEVVQGSTFSACIPALIDGAERDAGLRAFHHQFQAEARRPLLAAILEGIVAGELPSHPNPLLAAEAMIGVIFYRRLMTGEPFDPNHATELVAAVLPSSPTAIDPTS